MILSGLIGLRSHDVLEAILHFCEVVSPPVEFLQADDVHRVEKELRLDLEIKRRLSCQRRTQVDLHEPGLEVLIDQNVEAEELETVVFAVYFLK